MNVYEAAVSRRTIRKFLQKPIPMEILVKLLNAARLAPSAGNLQPCEYILVTDKSLLDSVFSTLKWARYIAPDGTPKEGERPVAYVVVLVNTKKAGEGGEVDCAAAIENMILTAWEEGIGSCWIASVDRDRLREILSIPEYCKICFVVALGYKAEEPVVEEMKEDDVKYWKDEKGVLHVPKRRLNDIVFINSYGNKLASTGDQQ
ncbi:MAG: nitroreductase family protein [Candidatus Brockarchaeota archaeon]|nr:nitroreductase family protein [Candidatus Brockarchaeota archaeon]